jgi:MFS family permease
MADDSVPVPPPGPRRSLRKAFSAFRHRNYRLFFFGQLISVIGTTMQATAMPWLVYTTTKSALWLGIVAALSQLPSFFFSVLGGAMVDRLPKRALIIGTQSTAMCLAFALAALVHWHVVQLWHICAIALGSGLVLAIDIPARQSFVVDMVGQDDLTNAIALNSACFNLGRILGPVSAGFLILIGMDWCFFLNGVSFIAVIVGLLLMRLPRWQRGQSHPNIVAHIAEGFRYVRGQPRIVIVLLMVATVAIFGLPYQTLSAVFAKEILKAGPRGLGLMGGATGLGALVATLILASRQRPTWTLLFGVMLALTASLLGYGLSSIFPLSLAMLFCVGACTVGFLITCNSAIQLSSPYEMRGRVLGLYSMAFVGLGPFGSFLSGVLAHYLGAPQAVCIGATVCGVAALALAVWLRARRAVIGGAA